MSNPSEFRNVTALTKANVYFDGKVVSHTLLFADGSKKTLGLIYPGKFHFGTDKAERMEIVAGSCSVKLDGSSAVNIYGAGTHCDVPAKSGVDITLTCVLRDQKENAAVGGVPDSAHLTKRAVDIRSRTLTQEQITWALAYVKARWSNLIHIIYHNGGTGPHIHLNLNFPFAKEKAIKAADMALPKPA